MSIAREALDLAKDVDHRVNAHEDICALRYNQLELSIKATKDEVGDVKKILAWAGTTGFAIVLALLGFLMKAQFDANTEMQRTIQNLQQKPSEYDRK